MKSPSRVLVVVLAAAAAACGGDEGGENQNNTPPKDTTPPTLTMTPAGSAADCDVPGGWQNTDVANLKLEASETATIAFTYDGADPAVSPASCGGPCNSPVTITSLKELAGEGKIRIRAIAKDKAGNVSNEISGWFCIDMQAPLLSITPRPAAPATSMYIKSDTGSTTVTLKTLSETVTLRYTTDGSDPKTSTTRTEVADFTQSASQQITVTDNTTVKYYGIDRAGNESAVGSYTYRIIPSRPSVRGTIHLDPKYTGKPLWLFAHPQGNYQILQAASGGYAVNAQFVKKFTAAQMTPGGSSSVVTCAGAECTVPYTFDALSEPNTSVYVWVASDMNNNGRIEANCVPSGGGLMCSSFEGTFPREFLDKVLVNIGDPSADGFDPATDWTITGVDFYMDIQDPNLGALHGTVRRGDFRLKEMHVIVWQDQGQDGLYPVFTTPVVWENATDDRFDWKAMNLDVDCLGGANSSCDYYASVWMGSDIANLEFEELVWGASFDYFSVAAGDDYAVDINVGMKVPGRGSIAGTLTLSRQMPAGSAVYVSVMSDAITDAEILAPYGIKPPFGIPLATYRITLPAASNTVDYLIGDLPPSGTGQFGAVLPYLVQAFGERDGAKTPPPLRPFYATGGRKYDIIPLDSMTDAVGVNVALPLGKLSGTITSNGLSDRSFVEGRVRVEWVKDGETETLLSVGTGQASTASYTLVGLPAGTHEMRARAAGCGDKNEDGNYFNDGGVVSPTPNAWSVTTNGDDDLTQDLSVNYTGLVCQ